RLGLLYPKVSQVVNVKEKFLKEINAILGWIEDHTSYNTPLSRNQIQNKSLTPFNSIKVEKIEEAEEANFEANRCLFMRLKERSYLYNIKVKGEALSAGVEAAASFPEDIFSVDKASLYWKKIPSKTFIAGEEKSMPGFKASKDRLALLSGSVFIYCSENPKALNNNTKSGDFPGGLVWNGKIWMRAYHFTTLFTEYFKCIIKKFCSEKKIPLKILLLIDSAPGNPRALVKMYNEINVFFFFFHASNTVSILQAMDQEVTSTFKSYLRNTFHKDITAIDSDSSNGSGQCNLKTFWKVLIILDAMKNIHDSLEEFKASVEEVTADIVEIGRELEVEPEGVTDLWQSHDKVASIDEQKMWFLELNTSGEDAVKMVEMTTKDLEYSKHLVDKAVGGFERTDANFESSSRGNMLQNIIACYRALKTGALGQSRGMGWEGR
ncbi:hypothetical protein FD754_022060, partial [Muntiacus muntjak]